MYKISFRAMGSRIEAIIASESIEAMEYLQKVPSWFEQWEQIFSRFRWDSELCRLNRQTNAPVKVSRELWDVLQVSLLAEEESDGLVTPAILDALELTGYDRSFDLLDTSSYKSEPFHSVLGIEHISLDAGTRTIILPEGLRLDFGGSAKGWAAHQAAGRLSKIAPSLINAGGDIAMADSEQEKQVWEIGITDPFGQERSIETLRLDGGGVATSGVDYRRWHNGPNYYNHIIDPRTGRSVNNDVLSSTVIAPDVMEAEMAAKTSILLGSEGGLEWLNERPHLAGFLILKDKSVQKTRNMDKFILRKNERRLFSESAVN